MIQIRGAEKLEKSIRLFIPNNNEAEKKHANILFDNLTNCLEGFTVTKGKGVYKMKATNTVINENCFVVDISLNGDEGPIKAVISHLKEYGINAHEEAVLFSINGVSYIADPNNLGVW